MHAIRFLTAIAMSFSSLFAVPGAVFSDEPESYLAPAESLDRKLLERVKDCLRYNDAIPSKEQLLGFVDLLKQRHALVETGDDSLRVRYVLVQGTLEHVLACAQAMGEIKDLVCVIHTPAPATPLCMRAEQEPSVGLLDASIADDPQKLLTVQSRAQTVREYLHKGGKLYVVYPKGGKEKRSAEQRGIYEESLAQFPGLLVDWVLDSDTLSDEMIGATCLFRDQFNTTYAFSIQATQASSPKENSTWGLWFGPLNQSVVSERVETVLDYLDTFQGPNVREELQLAL